MSVLTIVTLLIAVTTTFGTDQKGNNEVSAGQTGIPKKPLDNLLSYNEDNYKEAFQALDVNNDNEIKIDDLKKFYYHADSEFAINKFIRLLDTPKTPGSIDLEEFTSFMDKYQVKRQAQEITYLGTVESRKQYFADEILTYVYLVIDQDSIDKLFDLVESNKNGKLDINEIKGMQVKIMNGDTKYELSDADTKIVLAEIGGGSDTISKEDFKEYLQNGELSFFFRECRKKVTDTGAEYDNPCLVRMLVRYTTRHVTEYMTTLLFDALDVNVKNQKVTVKDVRVAYGCNEYNAKRFIVYITGGHEMSYGGFRTIMTVPAIKNILEKGCIGKDKNAVDLEGRALCMKWKLWYIIRSNFFPNFVGVPDLDLIFLFEDLDTSNNGIIEQKEDLEKGKHWSSGLAAKLIEEVKRPEKTGIINLHDFFSYAYEPYMMTAVAECQLINDNNEKLSCYNDEFKDMVNNILDKKEVDAFFGFYKHNVIYHVTLEEFNIPDPAIENFLTELGQGDHYVNPLGFWYFVRQQDLGHLFVTDENVSPKKHLPPSKLHENLLYYLEHYMTEYDIIALFRTIDVDNDMVIDKSDIEKSKGAIDADFVARIALYGNKEHASFHEFWVFLNSKAPGSQEPRKRMLEKDCGQINQEIQIVCFKGKLKELQ